MDGYEVIELIEKRIAYEQRRALSFREKILAEAKAEGRELDIAEANMLERYNSSLECLGLLRRLFLNPNISFNEAMAVNPYPQRAEDVKVWQSPFPPPSFLDKWGDFIVRLVEPLVFWLGVISTLYTIKLAIQAIALMK